MEGTNKQLSPTTFIKEVESVLTDLTRGEATRLAEHGWAWAVMYYDGVIPQALVAQLETLEARCQSLTM